MASNGLPVDRLRDSLRELKPEARALLMAELERGRLRGEELPALGVILRELARGCAARAGAAAARRRSAAFVVRPARAIPHRRRSGRKRPGRIARMSLAPIWRWISTDLMPAETSAYAEETKRLLLPGRATSPRRGRFHSRTRSGLHRGGALTNVNSLLACELVRRHDLFLSILLLVQSRLGARWHLVRLAVRSAETDVAARIARTPAALAITLVLDDIELQAMQLREALETREIDRVIVLLKEIHDARGLRTELDLPGDQPWGRQLAAVRAEVSAAIETQIVTVPGRVHRLLRPRERRGQCSTIAISPRLRR